MLDSLPKEIIPAIIIGYLPPVDVIQLSNTSKSVRSKFPVATTTLPRRILSSFTKRDRDGDAHYGFDIPIISEEKEQDASSCHSALISMLWKDQGWGNCKSKIIIVAKKKNVEKNANQQRSTRSRVVYRHHSSSKVGYSKSRIVHVTKNIRLDTRRSQISQKIASKSNSNNNENDGSEKKSFGEGRVVYHSGVAPHKHQRLNITLHGPIRKDDLYQLWYVTGGGGGHSIHLSNISIQTLLLFDNDPTILVEKNEEDAVGGDGCNRSLAEAVGAAPSESPSPGEEALSFDGDEGAPSYVDKDSNNIKEDREDVMDGVEHQHESECSVDGYEIIKKVASCTMETLQEQLDAKRKSIVEENEMTISENKQLQCQVASMKEEMDLLRQQLETYKLEKEKVSIEKKQMAEQIDMLEREKRLLNLQVSKTMSELESTNSELSTSRNRIAHLESTIKTLTTAQCNNLEEKDGTSIKRGTESNSNQLAEQVILLTKENNDKAVKIREAMHELEVAKQTYQRMKSCFLKASNEKSCLEMEVMELQSRLEAESKKN